MSQGIFTLRSKIPSEIKPHSKFENKLPVKPAVTLSMAAQDSLIVSEQNFP